MRPPDVSTRDTGLKHQIQVGLSKEIRTDTTQEGTGVTVTRQTEVTTMSNMTTRPIKLRHIILGRKHITIPGVPEDDPARQTYSTRTGDQDNPETDTPRRPPPNKRPD